MTIKIRLFNSEPVVELEGGYYSVNPLPYDLSTLEEDECYSFDDLVLIYRGKITKEKDADKAGLYLVNGGIYIHISEDEKEQYSSKNVKEFNISNIIDDVVNNAELFSNPDELEMIQNNGELTIPTIKPTDDFLTRLVKQVIIDKEINLKNYENKIEKGLFANMKLSLNTESRKMSVVNFKRWAEVLGFDCKIIISDDSTDKIAPLKNEIVYDSSMEGTEGED